MIPLVIAHRGYSARFEDNTLTAIREAFRSRADMCEVDLHLTKDGKIFTFHDYYMGGVRIAERTLQELKDRAPDNPSFEEILELLRGGKRFMFEAKDRRLAEVLSESLKDLDRDLFIIGSFDAVFLKEFKKLNPDLRTCLLLGSVVSKESALDLCREIGVQFLLPAWESRHPYPHELLSREWIEYLRDRGVEVISWHEERQEVLEGLLELPLYGVCTNDPPLVRRMVDERYGGGSQ